MSEAFTHDYQVKCEWTKGAFLLRKKKAVNEEESLGWHVCRTKLTRNIFMEARTSHEKCPEIIPEHFEPLFCGSERVATKF